MVVKKKKPTKDYTKEYIAYIEEDSKKEYCDQAVTAYLLKVFISLGFVPREPLDDFMKWFRKRIDKYKITPQQLEDVIDKFDDYWSGEDVRKITNFKSTFFNSFHLNPYLKIAYKGPEYINNV